jgi:hypothetical protein
MAVVLKSLAPAGSTGNNTHSAVGISEGAERFAVQFVVEAVGGTPTVTWKAQGSMDGSNWYDVFYVTDASDTGAASTRTATAVGAQTEFLDLAGGSRFYNQFRIVTSSNTNVTYRAELWCQQSKD